MGKPICEHQAIQLKLGEMATRARAARLLTLDAADAYDSGERCDMEAGMAKYFASESAVRNSEESMRIHGGYGYSKEYDIERFYRDSLLMCIGEGTNEMQRMIIAKQWVKRHPV
jgi:alkylation response protein AidB-like acyl-CoA dehydrogenase